MVHCKAGKGRTGMMLSALMFFISMFNSPEDAIAHYNSTRVKNMKGLTISSQKRYVKFMEGFLVLELIINQANKNIQFPTASDGCKNIKDRIGTTTSWYELYLKRYNKLIENMVFYDMAKKQLRLAYFSIGPFPEKLTKMKFEIH